MKHSIFANPDMWNAQETLEFQLRQDKHEVKMSQKDPARTVSWMNTFSLAIPDPIEALKCARTSHSLSQKCFSSLADATWWKLQTA